MHYTYYYEKILSEATISSLHESLISNVKNQLPAVSALQIYDNLFLRSIKICGHHLHKIY